MYCHLNYGAMTLAIVPKRRQTYCNVVFRFIDTSNTIEQRSVCVHAPHFVYRRIYSVGSDLCKQHCPSR